MQTPYYIVDKIRVATPHSGEAIKPPRHVTRLASFLRATSASSASLRYLFSSRAQKYSSLILPKLACTVLCIVAALLTGCAASQKPRARAFPWAAAKNARPFAPEKTSSDVSTEDLFADLGLAVPAPPSPVAGMPSGPQRPRVAVVAAGNGGGSHMPEAPMIAPQLSPEQTAAAQQQTSASVSVAERNIAASQGRSLNAMQSDLASKVRSFLAEAREAAHVGDWTRASNAAKKAEVLSQELAGSL
jgi:hypothetical protein